MRDIEFYSLDFEVRDYEVDLQGIVNNGVYFHYYEHTRHKMALEKLNLNFQELHNQGIDLVLVRAEIDYLKPLKSYDKFRVETTFKRVSRLKFLFNQTIIKDNGDIISKAKFFATCLVNGRPKIIPELDKFKILKDE